MNIYFDLLHKPIFSLYDVDAFYNNLQTSLSSLRSLINKGQVTRIKRNMYTCISGETGNPIANKYQIGCAISKDSYISHHSAMEYYGVCNQVSYDVYVSSSTRFRDFDFDDYSFKYVHSNLNKGIEEITFSGGVRVTSKERTIVDCIKDMDKISGIEEVNENISNFGKINQDKIIEFLDAYDNQFLFQKTGYLLSKYKEQMKLNDDFFDYCKSKIGKSKRYLTNESNNGKLNNEWNLVIPNNILKL